MRTVKNRGTGEAEYKRKSRVFLFKSTVIGIPVDEGKLGRRTSENAHWLPTSDNRSLRTAYFPLDFREGESPEAEDRSNFLSSRSST